MRPTPLLALGSSILIACGGEGSRGDDPPSLTDPLGETTSMLDNGTTKFGLSAPVLGDRGWSLSMFYPLFTDQSGYPSWVIVDPDLRVIDVGIGFAGYRDHEQTILADAGISR